MKAAAKSSKSATRRSVNDKGTMKQCSRRSGGKRSCKRVAVFQGHSAARSDLRVEPLDRPSGDIWLRAENLNEEFRGNIYKADGSFDDAALAKLDDLWRDRGGEVRAVYTELYEHLSRICDQYPGQRVDLVSGFRFRERDSSRHFHASAMDIRIKDVPIRELYSFAESLDVGKDGGGALGIGIYPTSQFIHVDFRAPGEPSFRWTDWSGHSSGKKKKSPGRTTPARKPVS